MPKSNTFIPLHITCSEAAAFIGSVEEAENTTFIKSKEASFCILLMALVTFLCKQGISLVLLSSRDKYDMFKPYFNT